LAQYLRRSLRFFEVPYRENFAMTFTHAIVRLPTDTTTGLTTADLGVPDQIKTQAQFQAYVAVLRQLGLQVHVMPELAGFADAHYVEDTAVVMPECAVITHPGAASRRGEVASVASVLGDFRSLQHMSEKGHMDGGDVLMIDKQFFIGLTNRTDEVGISEFASFVEPYGYGVTAIEVAAGLHLKSIVNYVGKNTLTVNEDGARHPAFAQFAHIVLRPEEEYAGNTLLINDHLITPTGFPDTLAQLQKLGLPITQIDTSEFRKMDGGLTCLSLRF
jgi:dimethylargininase